MAGATKPGDGNRITCCKTWCVGLLIVLLCGCTPRGYMVRTMATVFEDGLTHFEQDTDRDMLRQSLPATIKMVEAFSVSEPGNASLLLVQARLYAAYAEGFIFPDYTAASLKAESRGDLPPDAQREQLAGYYRKGMQAASAALALKFPRFEEQITQPAKIRLASKTWTPDAVPALFWYAFCLARYVDLNRDEVFALSRAYLVELILLRVTELRPEYYHGGAHTVLMAYYASRSPMLGGDPAKARFHYDHAKRVAPGLLLTDVSWARLQLTRAQDRDTFVTLLTRISEVAAADTPHPFYNQLAGMLAELYLDYADLWF